MRLSSSSCILQYALIIPKRPRTSFAFLAYRSYASSARPAKAAAINADSLEGPRQNVAILGAGITGLSAAYHLLLTKNPPKITIYEKSDQVGGWINSKYVDLPDGSGKVLFETGPHNIRPTIPTGFATLALWEDLGLSGNMIVTPKNSVAARKRWIYYPDRLVEMPGPSRGLLWNIWTLLTEPLFKGYLKGMVYEMSVKPRAADVEDESVGEFLSRRVNSQLVDKLASAVLHGIYAGDAWQLSARSVFPDAWWGEKNGSVTQGLMMMNRGGWMKRSHADLLAFQTGNQRPSDSIIMRVKDASTVTLDGGLEMFSARLKTMLQNIGKVEFKTKTEVQNIDMAGDKNSIELKTSASSKPRKYEQIISTIPSRTLSYITMSESNPSSLSMLAKTPSVTVNVVNLYYSKPNMLPVSGFGYLIPQATPLEQNPELALGVIFDSDVVPMGQDKLEVLDTSSPERPRGTKLTVMLGGHWYDSLDEVPTEEQALSQAKSVVKRHLGITAEPVASLASTLRDCIPQYTVGHAARMRSAHNELLRRFGGRLKVAGASYSGVGINDCVVSGMEVAGYAAGDEGNWANKTGLDWAAEGRDMEYVVAPLYLKKMGIDMPGVRVVDLREGSKKSGSGDDK